MKYISVFLLLGWTIWSVIYNASAKFEDQPFLFILGTFSVFYCIPIISKIKLK